MKTLSLIGIAVLLLGSVEAKDDTSANPPAAEKTSSKKGKIKFEGGDGSSMEKAVIITGAKDTAKGIRAENDYLGRKFRRHEKVSQLLMEENGKHYDVITLRDPKGKEIKVFFDITDFYGKFSDDMFKD